MSSAVWVTLIAILHFLVKTCGEENCQMHGHPTIVGHWNRAISSYDAVGKMMYLEFDIQHESPETCQPVHHSVVELDGQVVARTEDAEAGVLIENVELGRHWMVIRVVDSQARELSQNMVEFVLPFHCQLVITEPPNRSQLRRTENSSLRFSFTLAPPANCSDGQCVLPMNPPAFRMTVDGVEVSAAFDIGSSAWELGAGKGCGTVADFGLLHAGRHSLAVELLDQRGVPFGPISYMHHVTLLEDGAESSVFPRGYEWIQAKGEDESILPPAWDVQIETDGLHAVSDGLGHGVFINPCAYRIPGEGSGDTWGVLFREHQLKGEGYHGYRQRLEPSRQWDGRLVWDSNLKQGRNQLASGVVGVRVDAATSRVVPVEMEGPPSLEGGRGPQDARLVPVGGRPLLWFNGNSNRLPSRVTQQFLPLPLTWWSRDQQQHDLPLPSEVQVSHAVFEKNFVAFDYQGQLFFAYSVEPHAVYHLNQETGQAELQFSTSNDLLHEAISSGSLWLHGGAVAIIVERNGREEYLSVCHTKEPDRERYLSFAYTFEAEPPFRITSWSPALGLQGKIQMAMGVDIVQEQDENTAADSESDRRELMVSYGSEDKTMRLAFFSLSAVLNAMEDLPGAA